MLETAGPPPLDTSVTFTTGQPRAIVLRHGPPENIVFAELTFPPAAFARQRPPGARSTSSPARASTDWTSAPACRSAKRATLASSTPATSPRRPRRATSMAATCRSSARWRSAGSLPDGQLALLPSTRPASDNLARRSPAAGTYLVAARAVTRRLRRLRRARPTGRRDGAGDAAGRARRRHAGDRLRQAPPRAVRISARVARGRRAVGPLHLPRHRSARGVPLSRPRVLAMDAGRGLEGGRARRRPARASRPHCCGGIRRSLCPGCRASPAAPWAIWATTSCAPSSRCPTRRRTIASCPTRC